MIPTMRPAAAFIGVVPVMFAVICAIIIICIIASIRKVPADKAYVAKMYGAPDSAGSRKILREGVHFLMPFLTQITQIIPLTEQHLDCPQQICNSADGQKLLYRISADWQITNPERFMNSISQPEQSLAKLLQQSANTLIAAEPAQNVLADPHAASERLKAALIPAAAQWGVSVLQIGFTAEAGS